MSSINILVFATIIGAIFSTLSIFIPSKWKSKRISIFLIVLIMSILSSVVTYQYSKLIRIERISKSASLLLKEKEMGFTNEGYIQACLAFLETNKDIYPDSYNRADSLYREFKTNDKNGFTSSLAFEFSGLIKGIKLLNDE